MREFTKEERLAAASAVLAQSGFMTPLREETRLMVVQSWGELGELSYCVSNQYAIQLQCELTEARKALAEIAEMNRIDRGNINAALDIMRFPFSRKEKE